MPPITSAITCNTAVIVNSKLLAFLHSSNTDRGTQPQMPTNLVHNCASILPLEVPSRILCY